MANKKAYYMGGGGVNEPTPGKKKYKSDPAIVVQPRFVEPFYRNYDLYDVEGVSGPAKHGPGSGWSHMNEHDSIKDFLEFRRKRLQDKYVAEDSWIEDTSANRKERIGKMKIRASLLSKLIKIAGDNNDGPNFDYGKGLYSNMGKYKSVKDFEEHADKGPGAFFVDDNADHMLPPKEHGTSIYDWKNSPYQGMPKAPKKRDSNNIDFPIDDEVNHDTMIRPEEGQYHPPKLVGPSGTDDLSTQPSNEGSTDTQIEFTTPQIAGEHSYVPEHDFEGKSDDALDFGRDYTNDEAPVGRTWDDAAVSDKEFDLDGLEAKYLQPAESEIYGLPDGVESEAKDGDQTVQNENPFTGISDIGTQMYEDKWNI